jgi:hypothetical protein
MTHTLARLTLILVVVATVTPTPTTATSPQSAPPITPHQGTWTNGLLCTAQINRCEGVPGNPVDPAMDPMYEQGMVWITCELRCDAQDDCPTRGIATDTSDKGMTYYVGDQIDNKYLAVASTGSGTSPHWLPDICTDASASTTPVADTTAQPPGHGRAKQVEFTNSADGSYQTSTWHFLCNTWPDWSTYTTTTVTPPENTYPTHTLKVTDICTNNKTMPPLPPLPPPCPLLSANAKQSQCLWRIVPSSS